MSADDTTLVIGFRLNGKRVYVVLQVCAAENFEEFSWFLYFLEDLVIRRKLRVTPNRGKAFMVGANMEMKHETEYGIKEGNYFNQPDVKVIDNQLLLTRQQFEAIDAHRR